MRCHGQQPNMTDQIWTKTHEIFFSSRRLESGFGLDMELVLEELELDSVPGSAMVG